MRMEVKFNVDFNVEKIMNNTIKSIEELREYIDANLCENIEEVLKYEFEEDGLVSISDVNATYIPQDEE